MLWILVGRSIGWSVASAISEGVPILLAPCKWGVCDLPNSVGFGNHVLRSKYDHETDELPATQGQPNTRQNYCRLKVAFWVTFFCPTANNFSWVGLDFISVTDYRKPNPTQILRKHHNKKKVNSRLLVMTRILVFFLPNSRRSGGAARRISGPRKTCSGSCSHSCPG